VYRDTVLLRMQNRHNDRRYCPTRLDDKNNKIVWRRYNQAPFLGGARLEGEETGDVFP
jgi:hypothetical protein